MSKEKQNGVDFTFERIGQRRVGLTDVYASLMGMKWRYLLLLFALAFLLANGTMAALYVGVGDDLIKGARPGSFADAFFFSVHTITTIGYGSFSPATPLAEGLVALEAFLGLVGFALVTGIVFARFSRPTAGLRFSSEAVVLPHNGIPTLMFRVANARGSDVIDAQVSLSVLIKETTQEGEVLRRFHELRLLKDRTPLLLMTWLVMHPIDEASPLYGMDGKVLQEAGARLVVSLRGHEGTFGQTVYAYHFYATERVHFDHRFVDVMETEGKVVRLDLRKFDEVKPLH